MQFKAIFISLLSLMLILGMFVYFLISPSYQKSTKARVLYYMDDYETSYKLSKEAYEMEPYNKMAYSVMKQSLLALDFISFINEANTYYEKIEMIVRQSQINNQDKFRIKMMTQIVIDRFDKLSYTRMTDKKLVQKAKALHNDFLEINKSIIEQI
jgi:hypothetical protein